MRKFILFSLLLTLGIGVLAENDPLFTSTPPDPAALALLQEAYLPALAANDIPQALALTDYRGFRQHLLDMRMRQVKAQNPSITPEQEQALSIYYQTNNLAPDQLLGIMGDSISQAAYTGMSWSQISFAEAPAPLQGFAVQVLATDTNGADRQLLFGIKKLGDQWLIAPEIPMEIVARLSAARQAGQRNVPLPDALDAIVEDFFHACEAGDTETAYALFGLNYRSRIPFLGFLGIYQELIERIGVPRRWTLTTSRQLASDLLGLGLTIHGDKSQTGAIMTFRKMGQTWVLDEAQFRPPSLSSTPSTNAPAATPKPLIPPANASATPATPAAPFPSMFPAPGSGPAKPIGPVKLQ